MCVQNFKSEKKLQVPASIRKLLTFISSMLYTLHNTWGDVLLVVLVNLRKNKKKDSEKLISLAFLELLYLSMQTKNGEGVMTFKPGP